MLTFATRFAIACGTTLFLACLSHPLLAQPYTVGKTSGFNIRAFDLSASGATDNQLNSATETLNIWNANPVGTGPIATNYNIVAYQTDTEATVNFAGGGDFGTGNIALNTIGGGTIPVGTAEDISVRALAFLAIPVGQWSISIASDDGRYMSFTDTPGGVVGFTGFSGRGDNVTTTGTFTATTTLGFDGTTGHNQSVGTFTVSAAQAEAGTNLALISLDGFYFERGSGGGSFEIAIRPGIDPNLTFDGTGEGWQLLSDNQYGWHVSTTAITLTPTVAANNYIWDGATDDWRAGNGVDTHWTPPGVNLLNTTALDNATVGAIAGTNIANITNAENVLNLTINNNGTVNVNAGSLTAAGDIAVTGAGASLNINTTVNAFTMNATAGGNVTLNNGTLNVSAGGTLGDFSVNGTSTLNNAAGLAAETLTLGAVATLNKTGGGGLSVTGASVFSGSTINNNDASTITLSGQASGAGGLTKNGNGTIDFNNAANNNNYTGLTLVNAGVVDIRRGNDLGASGALNNTEVNAGGAVRLQGTLTTPESFTIAGTGFGGVNGALFNSVNDNNIDGLVTLDGAAQIRIDNNRLRLRGGVALGTSNLTWDVDGGTAGEIVTGAITGSANIIKNGDGDLDIRVSSPAYTGNFLVQNGVLDVNQANGLGTAAGNTVVSGGATLRLRDGVNLATENISISGNGEGNAGAIRSENNSNQLGGTVTMTGNSRIHVNATQLTLNGMLTESGGARQLEKTGAGTLILNNVGNNYTGRTIIAEGTLQAGSAAALNSTSDVHVGNNASLQIGGGGNLTKPITANGSTTIGNPTAATTSTISGALNVVPNARLTFNGAGDLLISSSFGNGAAPINYANSLSHYGYHINNDAAALDLNNNAGMMGSSNPGVPTSGPSFNGLSFVTIGPSGRGLDFDDDTDFIRTGSIAQGDNYSNLFVGTFTPNISGSWNFRFGAEDDSSGIWVDLNQNGVFESSVAGLGDNRGEQLRYDDTTGQSVTLTGGQQYMIAFTHRESGGGSQADVRFTGPAGSGFTTESIVNPSSAAQAGLWNSFLVTPSNTVTKNGTGTTTLAGNNTYNGVTLINQGTLVAASNNALGIADGTAATGTKISNGATLGIGGPNASGPVNIGNEHLTLAPTATIRNMGGVHSIASANIVPDGTVATAGNSVTIQSGSAGDRLTIGTVGGSMNLGFSALTHAGSGETTIESNISAAGIGTNGIGTANGLQTRRFTGSKPASDLTLSNAGAPAGTYAFDSNTGVITQSTLLLSNAATQTGIQTIAMNFDRDGSAVGNASNGPFQWQAVVGAGAAGDQSNFQMAWTGEFTPDATGTFTFRTHDQGFTGTDVDDDASIYIDANQDGIFQSTEGFNSATGGAVSVSLLAGQKYRIAMTYLEGGGDEEVSYSFQGTEGAFTALTGINPGALSQDGVFTHRAVTTAPATYHLVKNDDGILRLNGNNTYNGNTDLNNGTLIINGTTSGQGSYEVASGSILGGDGTIGLKPGASVVVDATPGVVSPGDAGPGYSNGSYGPTFSEGTDAATVGTLSVDQPAGGIAMDLNGILQIDIVDPATHDMLVAINGQIDLDGSTSILNINGRDGSAGNGFELIDFGALGFEGTDLVTLVEATDGVVGSFSNMPTGSFLDANGQFMVTFGQDATSVFISLQQTPEPATLVIWTMLGLVGVSFAWRRRCRSSKG